MFENINKLMFTVEYAKKNWLGKTKKYYNVIYADSIEEVESILKKNNYLWYKIYSGSVIPEVVFYSKKYLCNE